MKICSACGKKARKCEKYCSSCGNILEERSGLDESKRKMIIIGLIVVVALLCIVGSVVLYKVFRCQHDWSEATCTTLSFCLKCGEERGDYSEHTWIDATCTQAKICSSCGLSEGEALGHNWEEPSCTTAKKCARCGVIEGAALGHTYEGQSCTKEGVCIKCGDTIDALGHEWEAATCQKKKNCTRCGQTVGDVIAHNYVGQSCTEEGICSMCGNTIAALGHDWSEATCEEPKICNICGEEKGEARGHSYEGQSCTEQGVCTICGDTIAALGHNWLDATCIAPKTCSICKMSEGDALGHTNGEICTRCGYQNEEAVIQAAQGLIYLYGVDLKMDSVGGNSVYITWKNMSEKDIKYIKFTVQFYNAVNDILADQISGKTSIRLTQTGPIPTGKGNWTPYMYDLTYATCLYFRTSTEEYKNDKANNWADRYWDRVFYASTVQYAQISSIEIEYMDGSVYTISNAKAISSITHNDKPYDW